MATKPGEVNTPKATSQHSPASQRGTGGTELFLMGPRRTRARPGESRALTPGSPNDRGGESTKAKNGG